ncbi:MAG: molybdopterin-dependent oxidoreductase [Proteobacteria bacterium]|nr:molybdopterin-dependent oxidoreductase [Pseudomonadota bacterium]
MKKIYLALFLVQICLIVPPNLSLQAKVRVARIKLTGDIFQNAPEYLTITDIEQSSLTEYRVRDPYTKKDTTYKGVLLRDFIKKYGHHNVKKIIMLAIDGYRVEFLIDEWARWDILLATQKNGYYMGIKQGGPARIVFPYHKSKDIDKVKSHPKWIWQIKKIEFVSDQ